MLLNVSLKQISDQKKQYAMRLLDIDASNQIL